ncbi:MAG: radical SAM protein [Thermoleophilaceae bacterium]
MCEHIHLPLQAGSSRVLKAMRRTYDRGRYMDRVAMIRDVLPDVALTTDIIVGFPGETEAEFCETLEVAEQVAYDSAFTFVFSPRRETTRGRAGRPRRARGEARADAAPGGGRPAPRPRSARSGSWGGGWRCSWKGRSRNDPDRLRGRTRHNKTVNFTGLGEAGEMVWVDIESATSTTLAGEAPLLSQVGSRRRIAPWCR